MLTPAQLTTLRNEINNDPNAYGYAPLVASGQDAGISLLLDKIRDGSDGFPVITTRRNDIAPNELLEAIDTRDLSTTTAPQLAWLQAVANLRAIRLLNEDGSNTRVGSNLQLMIPAGGQQSRSRINAISIRNGSRAEQLFGPNTILNDIDIAQALGRG